jgi:lipopolysaccharide export LptBFGC system permease protein LptF
MSVTKSAIEVGEFQMRFILIALPFVALAVYGFERFIAVGASPGDEVIIFVAFLWPMAFAALVPTIAVLALVEYLRERRKRGKSA